MKTHLILQGLKAFSLRTSCMLCFIIAGMGHLSAQNNDTQSVSVELERCPLTAKPGEFAVPVLLLTVQNNAEEAVLLEFIDLAIPARMSKNVRLIGLYTSPTTDFYAQKWNEMVNSLRLYRERMRWIPDDISIPEGSEYRMLLCMSREYFLPKGTSYLWITADIKPKAKAGCHVDADVLMMRCRINGESLFIKPVTKGAAYRANNQ